MQRLRTFFAVAGTAVVIGVLSRSDIRCSALALRSPTPKFSPRRGGVSSLRASWIDEQVSLELPTSSSAAWSVYSDLQRQPEWSPWLKSVEYDPELEISKWVIQSNGIRVSWKARNTLEVPGSEVAWESTTGLSNRGRVAFQDTGQDQCLMTLTLSYNLPYLIASVLRLEAVERFVKRTLLSDLERFKKILAEEPAVIAAAAAAASGDAASGDVSATAATAATATTTATSASSADTDASATASSATSATAASTTASAAAAKSVGEDSSEDNDSNDNVGESGRQQDYTAAPVPAEMSEPVGVAEEAVQEEKEAEGEEGEELAISEQLANESLVPSDVLCFDGSDSRIYTTINRSSSSSMSGSREQEPGAEENGSAPAGAVSSTSGTTTLAADAEVNTTANRPIPRQSDAEKRDTARSVLSVVGGDVDVDVDMDVSLNISGEGIAEKEQPEGAGIPESVIHSSSAAVGKEMASPGGFRGTRRFRMIWSRIRNRGDTRTDRSPTSPSDGDDAIDAGRDNSESSDRGSPASQTLTDRVTISSGESTSSGGQKEGVRGKRWAIWGRRLRRVLFRRGGEDSDVNTAAETVAPPKGAGEGEGERNEEDEERAEEGK